ncbi:MAG: hypothetical protein HY320_07700 [Armatimonadetes bacterium]|nr:hypothetical protein [Armatimonadota bacterium]
MDSLGSLLIAAGGGAVAGAAITRPLAWLLAKAGLQRRNFAGEPVVTAVGLAVAFPGALAPVLFGGDSRATVVAATIAAFMGLGLLDDVKGRHGGGGFRGHFSQLCRDGRLTTGALKVLGGGAAALAAAAWLFPPVNAAGVIRVLVAAGLIALSANFLNLLDLRPLRALKVFALPGLALALAGGAPGTALAAMLGAGAIYAPAEARRRVMLGDAGSNPLGAALGLAAAGALPLWAQGLAVAALAVVHLYAESGSISAWIDAHPWVARLDRWGWSGPGNP